MQALQKTLDQIRNQLSRLSSNARLLIGSFVVILLMGLLLVTQYAGRSEMARLGLPNSADVRTRAIAFLEGDRIEYEDRGNDIYVPASQRFSILGQMNQQDIVSAESIDFNALIDLSSNPFIGRDQANKMWLTAKMNVLGTMISSRNDVSSARVVIDEPSGIPGIGRAHVASTASVMVNMKNTPLTQEIADTIGRMVAGSQAGLKAEHVTVTDVNSSRAFTPRGNSTNSSGDYLEHKSKTENHYQQMFENTLQHIPGAVVTINAVMKTTLETSKGTSFDDPVIAPSQSETRDFSSTNTKNAKESGVRPNAGAAIGSGSGSNSQVTENISKDTKESKIGGREIVIQDTTGYPLQVNAIVGMPRSHFVKIFQDEQGDAEAIPDAAQLATVVQSHTQRWEANLALLIKTDGLTGTVPGAVKVSMIYDFEGLGGMTGMNTASLVAGGGIGSSLLGNGMVSNIGLGALALLSVVMMFLMVRKANIREELPTPEELAGIPPPLESDDSDIVGEALEGEIALEGIELDSERMRSQQLLDQINDAIQQTPSDAAALLQKWVSIGD